jgi:hypothetical protein
MIEENTQPELQKYRCGVLISVTWPVKPSIFFGDKSVLRAAHDWPKRRQSVQRIHTANNSTFFTLLIRLRLTFGRQKQRFAVILFLIIIPNVLVRLKAVTFDGTI